MLKSCYEPATFEVVSNSDIYQPPQTSADDSTQCLTTTGAAVGTVGRTVSVVNLHGFLRLQERTSIRSSEMLNSGARSGHPDLLQPIVVLVTGYPVRPVQPANFSLAGARGSEPHSPVSGVRSPEAVVGCACVHCGMYMASHAILHPPVLPTFSGCVVYLFRNSYARSICNTIMSIMQLSSNLCEALNLLVVHVDVTPATQIWYRV